MEAVRGAEPAHATSQNDDIGHNWKRLLLIPRVVSPQPWRGSMPRRGHEHAAHQAAA
jgi:hypothetical protein